MVFFFPCFFTFFSINTVVASQERHLGPNGFCTMVYPGPKDTKKVTACVEEIKKLETGAKRKLRRRRTERFRLKTGGQEVFDFPKNWKHALEEPS